MPRPALWIAVPTFVVSLAVAASLQAGILATLVIAFLGVIAVGIFAERRLARIISSIERIARGDRYTMLPNLVGDSAIQEFAGTAGAVRAALIETDTLTVDQLRRETEARLHHAGQLFFTGNFRHAVEEAVTAFTQAGRSIRAPSGFDVVLDAENQHLHKPSIIGRMDEKNVIWPVWTSNTLIAPEPWSQWLPKNAETRPLRRAV
jgi:HAMP domain-containing protein